MKRILLAGDTHGNLQSAKYLINIAIENDCEAIVQLGDFGYWEHQASGIYFLDYIESRKLPWFFVDGNHENHTLLRRRYMDQKDVGRDTASVEEQLNFVHSKKGPWRPSKTERGFYAVRNNIFYIPRGTVWEWNSVRFAALGGAFSIDINWRKPGVSWWPEETIENEEVEKLKDVGKVDIFLSHDIPASFNIQKEFFAQNKNYFKSDDRTKANKKQLQKAVEYTRPNYLFHGHYHIRYDSWMTLADNHVIEITGLDCDETGSRQYKILDLKDPNDPNSV